MITVVEVAALTDPVDLSFAAEDLGKIDSDEAVSLLLTLARHAEATVREGAVYGLASHVGRGGLRGVVANFVVQHLAANDASPGVRTAAKEALEP